MRVVPRTPLFCLVFVSFLPVFGNDHPHSETRPLPIAEPDPIVTTEATKIHHFGPYLSNDFAFAMSPASNQDVLPTLGYTLRLGWIEPLVISPNKWLRDTYLEVNAMAGATPYQTEVGTGISLRLVRFLGLHFDYHRMMFNYSLVTFNVAPGGPELPGRSEWKPGAAIEKFATWQASPGGADVFVFHAVLNWRMGPSWWSMRATQQLWDVDAPRKTHVFEHSNDLLIETQDKVELFEAQIKLALPGSWGLHWLLEDKYYQASRTDIRKNLISTGVSFDGPDRISGISSRQIHATLGYWTQHPLLVGGDPVKNLMLSVSWEYRFHFLE